MEKNNSVIKLAVPKIKLGGEPLASRSRTGSHDSLSSVASAKSAASDASVNDFKWAIGNVQEAVDMQKEEEDNITEMENELQGLLADCQSVPRIKNCITDRVKKLQVSLIKMKMKHEQVRQATRSVGNAILDMHNFHEEREKVRLRLQGQLLRETALASTGAKRSREDMSSPEEKTSKGRQRKKRQRRENAATQRETPAQGDTPSVTQPATVKRRPNKNKRPEGLLVKIGSDKSYAEVLQKIRRDVNPDTSETMVLGFGQTRSGDLLLKLGKAPNRMVFADDVAKAVQGIGEVRKEGRKTTLEIRDMDQWVTEEETIAAISGALQKQDEGRKVTILGPNRRGQKMAIVVLDEGDADELLRMEHVRVGFVSCRIRKRVRVIRCYKCLGFGHWKEECKGTDRSTLCFKCGGADHHKVDCPNEPGCFLCKEAGEEEKETKHVAGSGGCGIFRLALGNAKRKEKWKEK